MVLRMKNFNILGFTEKSDFNGGCSRKTNIEKGDCLKRGLDSLLIWGGGIGKKEGVVFLRGVGLTPNAHYGFSFFVQFNFK